MPVSTTSFVSSSVRTTARASVLPLMIAGILWGTGGLSGSLLQQYAHLHPIAVAAYRLLIGGLLFCLFLVASGGARSLARGQRGTGRRIIGRLVAVGALLALYQTAYFFAVMLTSVSVATLTTIGSVPVFVSVFTAVRDRQAPSRSEAVAVALAIGGLALLTGAPDVSTPWPVVVAGTVLSLVSGAGFATMTVLTQRPVDGLTSSSTTAIGLLVGGVLLLPLALPVGMAMPMTPAVLLTAGYFGLVPTAIAYGAFFLGSRNAKATTAAMAAVLEPLTAAVLSVLLLGDRFTPIGVGGAVLLSAAVVLSCVTSTSKPSAATD